MYKIGKICLILDFEGQNMKILVGVVIAIVVLAALFVLLLCYMARVAVRPQVHALENERKHLIKYDFMQGESTEITNEHEVETFDGHKLWVGFVPGNPQSKNYVILSHGYTSTRYGMYKYAALWRRLGFHCVLYDNRGHGANKPAPISFGVFESRDLMTIIEDTYERYGRDIRLGLHGESMGAGLQIMALSHKPEVDFIVNDCGYAEILPVLRWKVKHVFHVPGWLPDCLPDLASPLCQKLYGFNFEEVRPIDRLTNNEIPICFVHGVKDTFTAYWHSKRMYEVNKGYKELHSFEDADHAECVEKDPDRYLKMMKDFVSKVYEDLNI